MAVSGDPFGWVGATLEGKLRVEAAVGEGGFGVVYRAHHLGFDAPVAFKCLKVPAELRGAERERFRETFVAEGRLLHKLSRATNGIVQALDVGVAESPLGAWTPYLVLEWLDGMSLESDLEARLARGLGGRALGETLELLEPAARALGVAHRMGVAHRDVKPANLFLSRVAGKPTLKVLDFGIAKVLTENESLTRALASTGSSVQAFTPKYGAPEQFTRRYGATGPWTDVFALALVVVEVVSGRDALEGNDTGQLFVSSVDQAARPTLRARGVPVSDAVESVINRALAIEPRERFTDADAFWNALRAASGSQQALGDSATVLASPASLPSRGSAPGVAPTLGGPSTTAAQVASVPTYPHQPVKAASSRSVARGLVVSALVAAFVLVAVVAVVGWQWLGRRTPPGPAARAPKTPVVADARSATARNPDSGPAMITLAPGTFEMGSAQPNPGELRAREVTISHPFRITERKVSVDEYARCVAAGACARTQCSPSAAPGTAATCVTRDQAQSYCRWSGARLPSEAEWEFAARKAAERGIRGMSDDPSEWVADGYQSDLGTRAATDPLVTFRSDLKGVLRGGASGRPRATESFTKRAAADPEAALPSTGFRCVMEGS